LALPLIYFYPHLFPFGVLFIGYTNQFIYNFNSLTNGNLEGQGGWTKDGASNAQVQGTTVYEGAKGLSAYASEVNVNDWHNLDATSGQGSVWVYVKGMNMVEGTDTSDVRIGPRIGSGGAVIGSIVLVYRVATDNYAVTIGNVVGGPYDIATGLTKNAWHKIQIDYDNTLGTGGQVRGVVDDGTPSSWYDSNSGFSTDVSVVRLQIDANTAAETGTFYVDAFGYTPTVSPLPTFFDLM
jgi:hypothetical protein